MQAFLLYDFALRFRSAQRRFIISEIRFRAAALICRRGGLDEAVLAAFPLPAGLPRRRGREPSRAAIAESRRSRSLLS